MSVLSRVVKPVRVIEVIESDSGERDLDLSVVTIRGTRESAVTVGIDFSEIDGLLEALQQAKKLNV